MHAARINPDDALRAELMATMQRLVAEGGWPQCVERLLVLTEPPQVDAGVTAAREPDRFADERAR